MAYHPDSDDPFAGGEKLPSLSWKGLPIGTTFTVEIVEEAKALQSRDFETGELAFWDAEHTRPKMAAVLNVLVTDGPHSVGEQRSIWASIPSDLFFALKEAQKQADAKFTKGGKLQVRFHGETPHENKRYNPIKNYKAKYTPPAKVDPFDEKPASPTARPASTATW
jgi:hypothetical protein